MPEASAAKPAEDPVGTVIPTDAEVSGLACLGHGTIGLRGHVVAIRSETTELERILLEIGFIEGAHVEILHEGPFGRDPIAVRVDDMRVALRRSEAAAVMLRVPAGVSFG